MPTERETVLREQAAYAVGYMNGANNWTDAAIARSKDEAAHSYPLPKVTRNRVVKDEYDCEWRMGHGAIEWRGLGQAEWCTKLHVGHLSLTITPRRAAVIADLFANPTEEVEG
jgi:hypothetical protein